MTRDQLKREGRRGGIERRAITQHKIEPPTLYPPPPPSSQMHTSKIRDDTRGFLFEGALRDNEIQPPCPRDVLAIQPRVSWEGVFWIGGGDWDVQVAGFAD